MPDPFTQEILAAAIQPAMEALVKFIKRKFVNSDAKNNIKILLAHVAFSADRIKALENDKIDLKDELKRIREDLKEIRDSYNRVVEDNKKLIKRVEQAEDQQNKELAAEECRSKYELDERYGFVRSKKNQHPYCPVCLKNMPPDEFPLPDEGHLTANLTCPQCGTEFKNPNYRPPRSRAGRKDEM